MSKKNLILGTMLGLAAGAVAGVLMAPKSGKESRELLAKKSKGCMKQCHESLGKCCDTMTEFLAKEEVATKKVIKDAADKVSENMN
ncbi:MAG: YtxH domain-containing protein [bacterium]